MNLVLSRAAFVCALLTVSSGALAAKKTSDSPHHADAAPHHARASSKASAKKHGKSHHKHSAKAAKGADAKGADKTDKPSDSAASEEVAP